VSRDFTLAKQTDGINRMRTKGGASDTALYDLVNGDVNAKGVIHARKGTRKKLTFGAGTIGAVGHLGKIHTFAPWPVANPNPGSVVVDILRHPTAYVALAKIHRAFPVLGRLYVVAEFVDGLVKHYWLDNPATWTANKVLSYGYRVRPITDNGYYYRAVNVSTAKKWTASTIKTVGSVVQPSTPNGFTYTATALTGTAPIRTSNTEPTWPTTDGATVTERRYMTEPGLLPGDDTPPASTDPSGKPDDYGPYPPSSRDVKTNSSGVQN
jgi:hypothetical protein